MIYRWYLDYVLLYFSGKHNLETKVAEGPVPFSNTHTNISKSTRGVSTPGQCHTVKIRLSGRMPFFWEGGNLSCTIVQGQGWKGNLILHHWWMEIEHKDGNWFCLQTIPVCICLGMLLRDPGVQIPQCEVCCIKIHFPKPWECKLPPTVSCTIILYIWSS